MAGLEHEDFERVRSEILAAWAKADSRDAGLAVMVEYGRKYGFKNVMTVLQGRTPKRFAGGQDVDSWIGARKREESQD